jgi:putative transposase
MVGTAFGLVVNVPQFVVLGLRSHARLSAENLFLRKQLALYLEREAKPHRATNATRLTLVALARFIEWRPLATRKGWTWP